MVEKREVQKAIERKRRGNKWIKKKEEKGSKY